MAQWVVVAILEHRWWSLARVSQQQFVENPSGAGEPHDFHHQMAP